MGFRVCAALANYTRSCMLKMLMLYFPNFCTYLLSIESIYIALY